MDPRGQSETHKEGMALGAPHPSPGQGCERNALSHLLLPHTGQRSAPCLGRPRGLGPGKGDCWEPTLACSCCFCRPICCSISSYSCWTSRWWSESRLEGVGGEWAAPQPPTAPLPPEDLAWSSSTAHLAWSGTPDSLSWKQLSQKQPLTHAPLMLVTLIPSPDSCSHHQAIGPLALSHGPYHFTPCPHIPLSPHPSVPHLSVTIPLLP